MAENLAGGQRSAAARVGIYAMFTDPPLAHVGLYEADAQAFVTEGRRISQAVHAMKDVSRAKEEGETVGKIKLLIDEDSGHFLGATMLGIQSDRDHSGDRSGDGQWRHLEVGRDALPVHPTVTEFLPTIIDRRKPLTRKVLGEPEDSPCPSTAHSAAAIAMSHNHGGRLPPGQSLTEGFPVLTAGPTPKPWRLAIGA